MSDIASTLRRHWLEIAWAAFATINLVLVAWIGRWETVPFHLVWVSLTLLYGIVFWSLWSTATVLVAVTVASGAALYFAAEAPGGPGLDEMFEVPLMAAMLIAMVWHVRRRQAATDQIERLAARQGRMLERERDFVRDASHGLRTPIAIARGHADLVRRATSDPQIAQDADVVLDELARLSRISDQLLTLAAAEHPDFLDRHPVEVAEIVVEVFRRWQPAAARAWAARVDAPGVVLADEERLRVALDAIIENAVKHTKEGGHISIVGSAYGESVVFEISDDGDGIPVEQVPYVFERFSRRTAPESGPIGMGLGLAIVKAIAEAHGGSVEVRSRPGLGTQVYLALPGFTPAAKPSVVELSTTEGADTGSIHAGKSVSGA